MLSDRDIVEDLVKDERFLNVSETWLAVEASQPLKQTFLDIIRDEQNIHTRLVQFMERQGWYPRIWGDYGYAQRPAQIGMGAQPYGGAYGGMVQPGYGYGGQQAWGGQMGYAGGAQVSPGQTTATFEAHGREYGPY